MKNKIYLEFSEGSTQEEIDRFIEMINYRVANGVKAKKEHSNIFNNIRQWAKDRGIYDKGDSKTQALKLVEEVGELAKAILKNDKPEIVDGIGDCIVVLTNLSVMQSMFVEDCIEAAYNVISQRTGKMQNGTFVKD